MPLTQEESAAAEGIRQLELAAFPTGIDWKIWWNVQQQKARDDGVTFDGWERAIIDATTRLIRNQLTLARLIRMEGKLGAAVKYDSAGFVHGEATMDPRQMTQESFAWFLNVVKPAEKDCPEKFQIIFKALEGCFLQQARLGIELYGIKHKGYLTVNHSATARNPEAFREENMERI